MRGLIVAALFVLLLAAGDRAAAGLIGRILGFSADSFATLYSGRGRADVVVLGNSRVFFGLDFGRLVEIVQGRVLNLSLPGAPTVFSAAVLGDYLDRYGPPRVVVLEISNTHNTLQEVTQNNAYMTQSRRLAALIRETSPRLFYAGQLSHLFNYNSDYIFNVLVKIFLPVKEQRLDGTLTAAEAALAATHFADNYFSPLPANVAAMREIVALADRYGFDLRLYQAPTIPDYAATNHAVELTALVHSLAEGRKLWDYGQGPIDQPSLFSDFVHLNRAGVDAFMAVVQRDGLFAVN